MAWALAASLVFSLAYAALAAKSRQAEKILIPLLDVLQSVPILGFLSITVTGFIALFPGRLLGVECAAIFAIFTSQAWNMTFSVYQSLRTVPGELIEAARMYHLSPWRRFWRLEVPHAVPSLVWNMMMSVSGGWFFVVASEAITVAGHTILLPGIGSYIAIAIEQAGPDRDRLGGARHVRRDPALRPAAVPPAARLVAQVPARNLARRRECAAVVFDDAAARAAVRAGPVAGCCGPTAASTMRSPASGPAARAGPRSGARGRSSSGLFDLAVLALAARRGSLDRRLHPRAMSATPRSAGCSSSG